MVRFLSGKQARQKLMERVVKSLFQVGASFSFFYLDFEVHNESSSFFVFQTKGEELKLNARKEAGLLNEESGSFLELDIYIPSLKIAFEYQVDWFFACVSPLLLILVFFSPMLTFALLCLCLLLFFFSLQDPHHYISAGYTNEPLESWKARDEKKHTLAKAQGITIISVPCWWDGKEER
jgi:hypothetical protein